MVEQGEKVVVKRGALRLVWLVAGFAMVGLGVLGAILPVMPSTVFFIAAAACFARSNPRLEHWILNLPKIGSTIRDYRAGLGMRRNLKIMVMLIIAVVVSVNAWFVIPSLLLKVACLALGLIGICYIWFKVPTREVVLSQRMVEAGEEAA